MEYRELGRTGIKVGEVGFGGEHIDQKPYDTVKRVIDTAIGHSVNIIDVFMAGEEVRDNIGRALLGARDKMTVQGHIGSVLRGGQYARSRDLAECRFYFEDLMRRLRTDYIDVGMLHFIDTFEDLDAVLKSGMLDYARELKEKGVIRAVGASSHSAPVASKLVDMGAIDVLMFSLNPAFDMLPADTDIDGLFASETYEQKRRFSIDPIRAALYRQCEERGVGITVMKGLGAGRLLNAASSPFGRALTPAQCIHYAMTRPGVASCLVGASTPEEMLASLAYVEADEAARDFTKIAFEGHFSVHGKCMYCNHCLPCPAEIDIAAVTKYADMQTDARTPLPNTLSAHYEALERHAGDCIECGSCEANCPFGVEVIKNMKYATDLFGL